MDCVIEKRLTKGIFSDDAEYFLTSLTDRFEPANELWAKALEKRFNKKFKPIFIQNAKQNGFFRKENYLIINKAFPKIKRTLGTSKFLLLEDYEDINSELSGSRTVNALIDRLAKKQDRVFLLDFTSSFLNIRNPKLILLGPDPKVTTRFDSKIEHIKLFNKLRVPRNDNRIYDSIGQVRKEAVCPFYISAPYTSGGAESREIRSKAQLDEFRQKLRPVNKNGPFIVARLIEKIKVSPNVSAVVPGMDKTQIICISDQILHGNAYLGNIYPSEASKPARVTMLAATKRIGNYLSHQGFRGLFGLDFIIDHNNAVYTVDLNPRRQGGYLCNLLMSKKVNIAELELSLALGETPPKVSTKAFQPQFAWAHSKVKPHVKGEVIAHAFKEGDFCAPFNRKGSVFRCVFYPKGHKVIGGNCGYIILSGSSRAEVKARIEKEMNGMSVRVFGEDRASSQVV